MRRQLFRIAETDVLRIPILQNVVGHRVQRDSRRFAEKQLQFALRKPQHLGRLSGRNYDFVGAFAVGNKIHVRFVQYKRLLRLNVRKSVRLFPQAEIQSERKRHGHNHCTN